MFWKIRDMECSLFLSRFLVDSIGFPNKKCPFGTESWAAWLVQSRLLIKRDPGSEVSMELPPVLHGFSMETIQRIVKGNPQFRKPSLDMENPWKVAEVAYTKNIKKPMLPCDQYKPISDVSNVSVAFHLAA